MPILRRVWSPRGQRPIAVGRRTYEWLYLYAFVHPASGVVEWLILPTVSTEAFSIAFEHFAKAAEPGPTRRLIVVLDGAGWHHAKGLRIPEGVHLYFQPPYSPEVQPSEHLWPLVREAVANQPIETLDELEEILVERCLYLRGQRELIHRTTFFNWWEKVATVGREII